MENQNQEIFKDVDEIDNYEISNYGRSRNKKTGKFLKPKNNTGGYKYVDLCKDGKKYQRMIHRLVAIAFIPNPNNYETVDHLDRNRQNNHVNNLRWASKKMQQQNRSLGKNNTSEIKGIGFYRDSFWQAHINNHEGKTIYKAFSCKKHHNAKELCINWRQQKEIEYGYIN